MKSTLLVVLYAAIAFAGFGPNVRIDHENNPNNNCYKPAITLGPGSGSSQPIYVAFEDDSMDGMAGSNIMFQRSTDGGRTWLPAEVLLRRGKSHASYPDITTDPCGDVYVVYDSESAHIYCLHSTDGGATWSSPSSVDDANEVVGSVRIVADSAGNLLCAWNGDRTGALRIWSSVSTDRGATWSSSVRVDDDTTNRGCFQADVFVQPGTNHYLVAAEVPDPSGPHSDCYLYRSTDMGQTFQPGVRLDTFEGYSWCGQPHVVADAQHIICDYTGKSENGSPVTEARILYTQPDTWGSPYYISPDQEGGALAISADGRVHTVLMVAQPTIGVNLTRYASSSDHGVSWSIPELVTDDTTADSQEPDIAADSAGHAFVVWQDWRSGNGWILFATNNPAAIAEQPQQQPIGEQALATIIHNVLYLPKATSPKPQAASLLDISGRQVVALKPGANDVSRLSPGVYFVEVRTGEASVGAKLVKQ
jgi:hypothetical protein